MELVDGPYSLDALVIQSVNRFELRSYIGLL